MKKILLLIGLISLIFIVGCNKTNNQIACTMDAKICPDGSAVGRIAPNCEFEACPNQTTISNPASVFCEQKGGKLEIVADIDGSQRGECILSDGTKCEEWAYFRGECNSIHTCTSDEKNAQICTMDYNPVCGKDNITYGNGCGACAAKIDSYVKGECNKINDKSTKCPDIRQQACTREYMPVCGYFNESIKCFKYPCGATYGNACTACADSKVAYFEKGECPI